MPQEIRLGEEQEMTVERVAAMIVLSLTTPKASEAQLALELFDHEKKSAVARRLTGEEKTTRRDLYFVSETPVTLSGSIQSNVHASVAVVDMRVDQGSVHHLSAAANDHDFASVQGQVLDDHGGPIAFARISALVQASAGGPDLKKSAFSDVDGHFVIPSLSKRSSIRLLTARDNYESGREVRVTAGQQGILIRLRQCGILRGIVVAPGETHPMESMGFEFSLINTDPSDKRSYYGRVLRIALSESGVTNEPRFTRENVDMAVKELQAMNLPATLLHVSTWVLHDGRILEPTHGFEMSYFSPDHQSLLIIDRNGRYSDKVVSLPAVKPGETLEGFVVQLDLRLNEHK